jgi:hypothetical protein
MRRAYSSLDSPAELKKKLRSIAIIFFSEIIAYFVGRKFVSKTIEMELMNLLSTHLLLLMLETTWEEKNG